MKTVFRWTCLFAFVTLLASQSAMAQTQAPVLSISTGTLNINPAGKVQMAYWSNGDPSSGQLRGGKIIDNTGNFSAGNNEAGAVARRDSVIQPLINSGLDQFLGSPPNYDGTAGFLDPAAGADAGFYSNPVTTTAAVVNSTITENGAPGYVTFAGKAVGSESILIAHTWMGDTNLDGILTGDDFLNFQTGFLNNGLDPNNNLAGWAWGDFNGDGVVNGDDFLLFQNAQLNGGFDTAIWAETAGGATAGSSIVPEPSALVLLVVGGVVLAGRRALRAIRVG